jgi:BNR repeat-containing family member
MCRAILSFYLLTFFILTGCKGLPVTFVVGNTIPLLDETTGEGSVTLTDQATVTGIYGAITGFYDEKTEKTFVTWMGESSNPYVQMFDYKTNTWSDAKQVGKNPSQDWHNSPSLTQLKDGRLLVVHSQHYENAPFKIAISPEPSSIAGDMVAWDDHEVREAPAAAYPKPVRLANGDIYIFYRETSRVVYPDKNLYADDRPIQYVWSEDNGKTWRSSKSVAGNIAMGSWGDSDNFNEIYLGQVRYDEERNLIHLTWTLAGGGPKGPNNHGAYLKNIYYGAFNPSNKTFYCLSEGQLTPVGVDLNKNDMRGCLVEDTGPPNNNGYESQAVGFVQVLQWDSEGKPLVGYQLNQLGEQAILRTAKWTGSEWLKSDVLRGNAGHYATPAAFERIAGDSYILYVLKGDLFMYSSRDGAKTWQQCAKVDALTSRGFGRLTLIQNYRRPAQLHVFEFANQIVTGPNYKIRTYILDAPPCSSDTATSLPPSPRSQ